MPVYKEGHVLGKAIRRRRVRVDTHHILVDHDVGR